MARARRRRWWLWARLAILATSPLWLLNLAVAFFGSTVVFPLSPSHLRPKADAVRRYLHHRVDCFWQGHAGMDGLIARAETRHKLPRGLLAALIQVESGTRAHRISPAGAMGAGQLMPDTARFLKVADPFDPAQNVDGSARYLAAQMRSFRQNVRLALAAYNAGPGNVRGGVVPVNGETEFYVAKVLRAWNASGTRLAVAPTSRAPF